MRKTTVALALAAGAFAGLGAAEAEPVEYVKVCSVFGAGFFYIPGTDTCLKVETGETRQITEYGQRDGETEIASRVGDTESAILDTNEQLSKTNQRLDKLEESHRQLEERFDDAFEQSLDGIAIAMALANPDMVAGERFAMKFNLGTYNGSSAFGVAVAGVLTRTDWGRVTLSGGVATTGRNTGGQVGVQLSW